VADEGFEMTVPSGARQPSTRAALFNSSATPGLVSLKFEFAELRNCSISHAEFVSNLSPGFNVTD
jgi:hypothetical protein